MLGEGRELAYDVEADGHLETATRIHCLCLTYNGTRIRSYHDDPGLPRSGSLEQGLARLAAASLHMGHNIRGFDRPLIQKLYPQWQSRALEFDTLTAGRFHWPDKHQLGDRKGDANYGRHSLRAWGRRLGCPKGDFEGPWDELTGEMLSYCEQDVAVTWKLAKLLRERTSNWAAMWWEHEFAEIMGMQQYAGFHVFEDELRQVVGRLSAARAEHERWLVDNGPKKITPYKRVYQGRTEKVEDFNPRSGQQKAAWLQSLGWKPRLHTDSGQPSVKAEVLATIDLEPAKRMLRYDAIQDLLEDMERWVEHAREGRVPAGAVHNGTVTHRCGHRILSNVPKAKVEGRSLRAMFGAPEGRELVGTDAKGLELRFLGARLWPYDGGQYAQLAVEGNAHRANLATMGLAQLRPDLDEDALYNLAKRTFYAWLYGAANEKLGWTATGKWNQAKVGARIRARLERGIVGLDQLLARVKRDHQRRHYLDGLDGRKTKTRSNHSALNTQLQSDGAILMKYATVRLHRRLRSRGVDVWTWGRRVEDTDAAQVGHYHDEFQWDCRPGAADIVAVEAPAAIAWAGRYLKVPCPMEGEVLRGKTWAETH